MTLRHLDSLLAIPELDAVQWVPGEGNEGFSRWVQVYQKIQAAGKGALVYCGVEDLPLVRQTLRPGGLALGISGVESREMGEWILKELERWAITLPKGE